MFTCKQQLVTCIIQSSGVLKINYTIFSSIHKLPLLLMILVIEDCLIIFYVIAGIIP